jgi:hypothetical protein
MTPPLKVDVLKIRVAHAQSSKIHVTDPSAIRQVNALQIPTTRP